MRIKELGNRNAITEYQGHGRDCFKSMKKIKTQTYQIHAGEEEKKNQKTRLTGCHEVPPMARSWRNHPPYENRSFCNLKASLPLYVTNARETENQNQ